MKFTLHILLIAFLVALAYAATTEQKPIIVSYDKDTPDSVIDQAMAAIKEAVRSFLFSLLELSCELTNLQGGIITHEYKIIKAFAATAPTKMIDTIEALGSKYNAVVEEDQVVSINGDSSA